jgi:hydroxypyruvate reductase
VAALLSRPGTPPTIENAAGITLIGTPALALEAAAEVAHTHGVTPTILGDAIEGESRMVAQELAHLATRYAGPAVLLSGGETTVTIGDRRPGRGGRNTEFLLSLACELDGRRNVWALAADTDGEDGANLGAAGALFAPDTMDRARATGLDATRLLEAHDSGSFFDALGDLVVTGPTRTNVNDFRAILILP